MSDCNGINVIGCGKLGLPLIALLASHYKNILGIDINSELILSLKNKRVPWFEPGLELLISANFENIRFSSEITDAYINGTSLIIVPTPSESDGKFSNYYINKVLENLAKHLVSKTFVQHSIVIVSTVMPGSFENEFEPLLKKILGEKYNFLNLVYSPEFIALGNVIDDMKFPEIQIVGVKSFSSANSYLTLVSKVIQSKPEVHILNWLESEVAKIALNSFITMKISYANQIGEITEGIQNFDASKVLQAIGGDSRIGHKYLYPAGAYGGPCFPRDNRALSAFASAYGKIANLAVATDVINNRQSRRVLNKVIEISKLSDRILLIGASYKPNTEVTEESPSLDFYHIAQKAGFDIRICDENIKNLSGYDFISLDELIKVQEFNFQILINFSSSSSYLKLTNYLNRNVKIIDLWGNWEAYEAQFINYFKFSKN